MKGKFLGMVMFTLVATFLAGCVTENGRMSGGYRFFFPQNSVTIVNNTNGWIDVERGSERVVSNLGPGQSYTINLYNFYEGGPLILVALCHTETGEYLGLESRRFHLNTGYRGREHEEFLWEVDNIRAPRDPR